MPEILLFLGTNCLGFVLMKICRGRKRKPSLEVVWCWVPRLEPDFGPIYLSFHSFFFLKANVTSVPQKPPTVFLKNLFIYLFLAALGLCCCAWAFSSCSEQGLLFPVRCTGFSLRWLLLLRSTGSRYAGFSSCGTRAQ